MNNYVGTIMREFTEKIVEIGAMVMKSGKAWGEKDEVMGWVHPTNATMEELDILTDLQDLADPYSDDAKRLSKGKVVKVRKTTTIQVEILED